MPELVIGTTVPTFKALAKEEQTWLLHAEEMIADAKAAGFSAVHFFAAIETDSRGMGPFAQLVIRLKQLGSVPGASGSYWTFSVDDHAKKIDGNNRLIRICTGRNLIQEFACRGVDVSHILFLDSDLEVPSDSVSKLMEVDHPIVGGNVPVYCLAGKKLKQYPFPVQEHWNTAGFLMVTRQVFRRIHWRTDHHVGGANMTDDPCYANDVEDAFGYVTRVRKDVYAKHNLLVPLERRGHDLRIERAS